MHRSLEFILGLLDQAFPAYAAAEDLAGEQGPMLRLWQQMGFLAKAPARHLVPSCPHCLEGVPFLLANQYVCDACQSPVDTQHLLLWPFDLDAFLAWLARSLGLIGRVRPLSERLWQLGSFTDGEAYWECFFARGGVLAEPQRKRLLAYRNACLLRTRPSAETVEGFHGPCLSLVELLRSNGCTLEAIALSSALRRTGAIRFDEESGGVWVGDVLLGEVPVFSKEHAFLCCLAQRQGEQVAYADIKSDVLRRAGSRDTTEEATFCHRLKSRIKKTWVPKIDALVARTNKGEGYRLRSSAEL